MMASTRLYGPTGAPGAPGSLSINTSGAAAPFQPVKQIIAGTAETVILNPSIPSPATPLMVQIPPDGALEQRPFTVEPSGVLETGASSTVTLKLYSGTSATVGSNTLLGSSGAISAFSGKCPWYATIRGIYDSISGKFTGSVKFFVNNTIVAEVAISNVITGVSNSNSPVLSFVMTCTFGTANAANTIIVQDFPINF
jgi:hypothetical protein